MAKGSPALVIRFLHTADWQIGKPFGGFDEDTRGELKAERFRTVERLARLACERLCFFFFLFIFCVNCFLYNF